MIAAIYARKSTEQNGVADENESVTRQIEHARAYARRKRWWMLILAVLFTAVDAAGQEFVTTERETLRGLRGVGVVLEGPGVEAGQDGLTSAAIQTDVHGKLETAGIRVLDASDPLVPFLYIIVKLTKRENGLYTYSSRVELRQLVQPVGRPGVTFFGDTWHTDEIGVIGANRLPTLRETVKDQVDRFIKDYLAVNPKTPPSGGPQTPT